MSNPDNHKDIIKNEILKELKYLSGILGHSPTLREFNIHSHKFKASYVVDLFGSWNKALWEARLELNNVKQKTLDKEAMLDKLRELASKIGRTPSQKDLKLEQGFYSIAPYKRLFGTWTEAVVAAGLKPTRFEKFVGDRKTLIIEWIKAYYQERGYLPTVLELQACKDAPSHHVIRTIFGSYGEAIKAAGFEPRSPGQNRTNYKGRKHAKND